MNQTISIALAASAITVFSVGAADGEIELLAGSDLGSFRTPTGGWSIVGEAIVDTANPKRLTSSPGTGVLLNGPDGKTTNILSKEEFGDVEAHIEFMVPKGSNSGVYFQGRYEIQVFDSWEVKTPQSSDCGGIYQRYDEKEKRKYEGKAPRINASKAPGQWQTFHVIFQAPKFDSAGKKTANAKFIKVVHNGEVIHENEEVTGPTRSATYSDEAALGPLMLQGDHGPVAYRNIKIKKL